MSKIMYEVPFFDFIRAPESLKGEWRNAFSEVIDEGRFIGGHVVQKFEREWAKRIGTKFAVGVGNGLDGLVLALRALQIGPGKRVAVPSHTFIATWNAVELVGATPIGVDVDHTGMIDLELLEKITGIDCVIPVHMHGAMVDMSRLMSWATKNGVKVIEDASQAHFAKHKLMFSGTIGDIGVFSLYPSKNLGALGDGGIVTTNSEELENSIRSLANYGSDIHDKYSHPTFGVNSRLDSIQAAILMVNLNYLDTWTSHRKSLAERYLRKIKTSETIKFLHNHPQDSVWHHFPILTNSREDLISHLRFHGITTEIHYPNLAAYENLKMKKQTKMEFPVGEFISNSILSLPISQWHSLDEIDYVVEVVNSFNDVHS